MFELSLQERLLIISALRYVFEEVDAPTMVRCGIMMDEHTVDDMAAKLLPEIRPTP